MKDDKFEKLSDEEIGSIAGAAAEKFDSSLILDTGTGWNNWAVFDRYGHYRGKASNITKAMNIASELDPDGIVRRMGGKRYQHYVNEGDMEDYKKYK